MHLTRNIGLDFVVDVFQNVITQHVRATVLLYITYKLCPMYTYIILHRCYHVVTNEIKGKNINEK